VPITQVHILGFLLAAAAVEPALVVQVVRAVVLDQQLLPVGAVQVGQQIFLGVAQVVQEVAVQQPLGEAADFLAVEVAVVIICQALVVQVPPA
jgi:hypothetical protein